METTNKKSVQQLINHLWTRGLTRIVISPGSRNAPLIIGFTDHPKYTCYSVPDERTAGFIALGMAHETKSAVALVCSSGSALLNYYPAITEAFYRKIPLVILSADRPERLVDQGDGQTIRQKDVYSNHILFSNQLEEFPSTEQERLNNHQIIKDALTLAIPSPTAMGGPVHLNIPFEEPLYTRESFQIDTEADQQVSVAEPMEKSLISHIANSWNTAKRILILVGQKDKNEEFDSWLNSVSQEALILSETTSNISVAHSISCIDRLITSFTETDKAHFRCDLLLTFGSNIVSKRIKALLREDKPSEHFHIEVTDIPPNTYQCLTRHVNQSENDFVKNVAPFLKKGSKNYPTHWNTINRDRQTRQKEFELDVPFSDYTVMETLNKTIPKNSILHLANSTPVRYAQLFDWDKELVFHANRGTSGIDGIVSTAMGTAIASQKQVFLIVGDISFFYDTNAWWHRHIPTNLKVIVVNNSGGGIFRLIDGPTNSGQLENHFETHQKNSVEHIALGFGVNYFCASGLTDYSEKLNTLVHTKESGILEVITPQEKNAGILKAYFKNFK